MTRLMRPLMPLGIVAIVIGFGIAHAGLTGYVYGGGRFGWGLAYAGATSVAAYSVGFPDVMQRARQVLAAAVAASAVGAITISLTQLALGVAVLPRFVVLGSLLPIMAWLAVGSDVARRGRRRARDRDRVVIVGEGEDVDAVAAALQARPERPAEIVAMLAAEEARGIPGGALPLVDLAAECEATVVVLDRAAQADQLVVDQVARLHAAGVRVRTLSLFYEHWLGRLPVGELERISLMFDIGEVHRARYARMKRVIDLAVAIPGLIALAAVTPLVWLVNLAGNRGSLFYRQTRIGKGGEPFTIWKFRSMRESDSTEWTDDGDDRITAFGGFLRRSHLDELPQFVNVVRGELSMVGPRPEQVHYVEQLREKLPFYDLRHMVQPGITGWAQVGMGYAASEADALEKLQYEFWYLRHQRFAVDVRILARTVRAVVTGDGR